MKVLILCHDAPWPPIGGANLRCWQTFNLLREWAEVALFALGGRDQPPPDFPAELWQVAAPTGKHLDESGWLKRKDGLPSDAHYDERTVFQLQRMLEKFSPDLVVLDHFWMHSYEDFFRSRGIRLILNAHNVEGSLARQLVEYELFPPARLQRRAFAARVTTLESALAKRMDQIWVCSEQDRRQFLDDYAVVAPVHIVPNAVDVARYRAPSERPQELEGFPLFLFAAGFEYPPNRKAADFLIRELFPKLSQLYPDGRLLLIGANPTPEMLQAAALNDRIVVSGRVPDMIPYLQHSSVMLAPLFTGSGTRFKIIEAFAAGLPVVSSAKGAEGLGAEPAKHMLLAEAPDAFVDAIVEILDHPDRTRAMVQSASKLVERFSWTAASEIVGQALKNF